jgi:hypothetical protein
MRIRRDSFVPVVDLQTKPCDFQRHRQGDTRDCLICGWHVWDQESRYDENGHLVFDGSKCPNERPPANRYGGG